MSKLSDAMDRARREQERPVMSEGPAPVVIGASRVGLPSVDVEAYQSLGSDVYLALPDMTSRVVMLVSAESGAGTSTVARGFAATLATNGEIKTLLIDANLRKPVVHSAFGIQRSPGIADLVLGDASLDDCLRDASQPNLSIMPAGKPVVAPPRVFGDSGIDAILRELRSRFELIVIDSAPLIPFAEGTQLSRKADGVVVVIRSSVTRQATLQRALVVLDDAGANVLGSVLNGRKFYIPRFIYDRL
ncbi:MAG: CpsD/CapB family tyrosine-protein kinase [Candidatus Eisenbacteria bacterium]|nr:CpsD/CapB family tyrosine-protein kinase [Candidatus Eisenbacteria bacterium]